MDNTWSVSDVIQIIGIVATLIVNLHQSYSHKDVKLTCCKSCLSLDVSDSETSKEDTFEK